MYFIHCQTRAARSAGAPRLPDSEWHSWSRKESEKRAKWDADSQFGSLSFWNSIYARRRKYRRLSNSIHLPFVRARKVISQREWDLNTKKRRNVFFCFCFKCFVGRTSPTHTRWILINLTGKRFAHLRVLLMERVRSFGRSLDWVVCNGFCWRFFSSRFSLLEIESLSDAEKLDDFSSHCLTWFKFQSIELMPRDA